MKEQVLISFTRSAVNVGDLQGFKDVLQDYLTEEGTVNADIKSLAASAVVMQGDAVRIVWIGSYQFASPDGQFTFGEKELSVSVSADGLNHDTLMKLMAARSRLVSQAYRNALQGILNLSKDIQSGAFVPAGSAQDYLADTLEAALTALPNNL